MGWEIALHGKSVQVLVGDTPIAASVAKQGEAPFREPNKKQPGIVLHKVCEASALVISVSSNSSLIARASVHWVEDLLNKPD